MNIENIQTKKQAIDEIKKLQLSVSNLQSILELERKEYEKQINKLTKDRYKGVNWAFNRIREDYVKFRYCFKDGTGMCISLFDLQEYMKNIEEFIRKKETEDKGGNNEQNKV